MTPQSFLPSFVLPSPSEGGTAADASDRESSPRSLAKFSGHSTQGATMKRTIPVLAAALTLLWAGHAGAASSTAPVKVPSTSALYTHDVAATVTVDGPATITLTNLAYRHPETVQATVVTTGKGTFEIRDRCKPFTLPHTWIVYINGVKAAATSGLKCE